MSENNPSTTTVNTSASASKSSSTTRKPVAVRSTRTPNSLFSGAGSRSNNPSASIPTSTRTRTDTTDKPLNRVQTAPTRPTGYSPAAETTLPRRQQTTDFPLSIVQSHSSDSQTFLTPLETQTHPTFNFQTQNQRESVASTEPSSYYSADDSFNLSVNDEDIPPLPNPHPLSTSAIATGSKQTFSTGQTPSTSASGQTVIPTQDSGLTYRTSTRTTASTSTRTTARSGSTGASVMEPSRQSTSDSEAYPRGNGFGSLGSKNKTTDGGGEEDLAMLVAGLEELVEEPEFDDEEPRGNPKGKMKMPDPQYFGTRLPTTQEEDEDTYGDYPDNEEDQTRRMPEPFTHSRDESSSTSRTVLGQTFPGVPSSTGSRVRKVSPLIIPPTPKSPPPVPSSIKGEKHAPISPTKPGGTFEPKPQPDEDKMRDGPHPLRAGSSGLNTAESTGGTAPLRIQRHGKKPSSASGIGGEGISSALPSIEKDGTTQQQYGTATITGISSSRIERSERERPGSGGGRMSTTSTSFSGTASGRVKTDSTSHRPSVDAHTYTHGRTTSTASASGVDRPPESRMSSGGWPRPLLPKQRQDSGVKEKRASASASAAVDVATVASRPRLPPGVSSQMDTQYVNMLLALDDIPAVHNLAAAFFNWIYLAGFVLFPGTFTSLKNLGAEQGNVVAAQVIKTVTQLPLFIVAWVCVGIGAIGMLWELWRWKNNYIWALNKIWIPGLLNSLAGLLSTLASIYGAQHGQFSPTSQATLILTGVSTAVFAVLSAFYMFWLVGRVKRSHDREVGMQRAGKHGEGVVDLSTRGEAI